RRGRHRPGRRRRPPREDRPPRLRGARRREAAPRWPPVAGLACAPSAPCGRRDREGAAGAQQSVSTDPCPIVDEGLRADTSCIYAESVPAEFLRLVAQLLSGSATPRLALSPDEAAAAIGVSRHYFDDHVAHELRWV